MFEYFVLTALLWRAFTGTFSMKFFSVAAWVFTLAFLYAVSDEVHQSFVLNRSGNPVDVMIDSAGAALFFVYLKRFKK